MQSTDAAAIVDGVARGRVRGEFMRHILEWAGLAVCACGDVSSGDVDGGAAGGGVPGVDATAGGQRPDARADAAPVGGDPPDAAVARPDAAPVDDATATGPDSARPDAEVALPDAAPPPADALPDGAAPPPDAAGPVCVDGDSEACHPDICAGGLRRCVGGRWDRCVGPPESCNGLDDDCNGVVDDGPGGGALTLACYSGPPGTPGLGICRIGRATCVAGAMGPCVGEQTPLPEICDRVDNDCNDIVDDAAEDCRCVPGTDRPCYGGPDGTLGVGECAPGRQVCAPDGLGYDACEAQILPSAERCNGFDDDCDGEVDDVDGLGAACTSGLGPCLAQGVRLCGAEGDLVCDAVPGAPSPERCNGQDDDCDGAIDDGFGVGEFCVAGIGACAAGGVTACTPEGEALCSARPALPAPEFCNGLDDDCDGVTDGGGLCPPGEACLQGACQPFVRPAECEDYSVMNTADRSTANRAAASGCDNQLRADWYRFEGAAGVLMPTEPPPVGSCGTDAPGWLVGSYPDIDDGAVERRVCFAAPGNACRWEAPVLVRNCDGYFVFSLPPTPACNLRYCGRSQEGELRIVGGPGPAEGRLEVLHDGAWGTICDAGFDADDAEVACRQLGHRGALAALPGLGGGAGPIWLSELGCTGDEASLLDCPARAFGDNACGHASDAGVRCATGAAALGAACRLDGHCGPGQGCRNGVCTDAPVCGDGRLEGDETCDDGNTEDGDGCSAACLRERRRRTEILDCGPSNRPVTSFVAPEDGLVVAQGCAPRAETQAMLVSRNGGVAGNGPAWRAYLEAGGVILTEFGNSDEVYNAVFGTTVPQGPRFGDCVDNVNTAIRYNEGDPFWIAHGALPRQAVGQQGCGYSVRDFPGIVALGGVDAGTVALGYIDVGAGRLWLVDLDWQDAGAGGEFWTPASQHLMRAMMLHLANGAVDPPPDPGRRSVLMRCGGSARNPADLVEPADGLVQADGCAPDADTQALLVTRGAAGLVPGQAAAWRAYVQAGGIILTEYSVSDDVYNAVFQAGVPNGAVQGECRDDVNPPVRFSEADPFWIANGALPRGAAGQTGCGQDMSVWGAPIVRLGGWTPGTTSLAYRDLGLGRVWLVETDWQDSEDGFGAPARQLMRHMILTRPGDAGPAAIPLGLNRAYGHHGSCESWNGCGNAETCADAACNLLYPGTVAVAYLEGRCQDLAASVPGGMHCSLFSSLPASLDDQWGGGCNIPVAYDVRCAAP